MKKTLLLCLLLAAVVGGCNKEERTFKKILGDYNLTSYTVDGIDSLNLFKDSLASDFEFHYNESDNVNGMTISGVSNLGKYIYMVGHWTVENKDSINIDIGGPSIGTGPIGKGKELTWDITSLTNRKFKLQTIFNNKTYEIELDRN